MVDVKMGAHHIVDLIDRDTGVRHPLSRSGRCSSCSRRTRGVWLVITDATVDQDVVVRGLQQDWTGFKARAARSAGRDSHRRSSLRCELWEGLQWIEERAFLLYDAVHDGIADFDRGGGHVRFPPRQRGMLAALLLRTDACARPATIIGATRGCCPDTTRGSRHANDRCPGICL
jgi:hypothetical protein